MGVFDGRVATYKIFSLDFVPRPEETLISFLSTAHLSIAEDYLWRGLDERDGRSINLDHFTLFK
jgi:hypothetical protein